MKKHISESVGYFKVIPRWLWGFSCGSAGKESTCKAGDLSSIPGVGRFPGGGNGYPLHYSDLENSMTANSPWGRKESDMTERLSFSLSLSQVAQW